MCSNSTTEKEEQVCCAKKVKQLATEVTMSHDLKDDLAPNNNETVSQQQEPTRISKCVFADGFLGVYTAEESLLEDHVFIPQKEANVGWSTLCGDVQDAVYNFYSKQIANKSHKQLE